MDKTTWDDGMIGARIIVTRPDGSVVEGTVKSCDGRSGLVFVAVMDGLMSVPLEDGCLPQYAYVEGYGERAGSVAEQDLQRDALREEEQTQE